MERLMPVVTLFLTLCAYSCSGPLTSQNNGRTLKQEPNAAQGVSSFSASLLQDTGNSAMPPVGFLFAFHDANMVSSDSASNARFASASSSSGQNVAIANCDVSRRIRARRQQGRISVIPNTDSQRACCELCRGAPNSACRSWYRSQSSQTSRCYLNSVA